MTAPEDKFEKSLIECGKSVSSSRLSQAIRTVNEAGHAVVPREVSEKMASCGQAEQQRFTPDIRKSDCEAIFKAMIACGEIKPEDVK